MSPLPLILLTAVVLISGCTTQPGESSEDVMEEKTLEESVEDMTEFMNNNPGELTSTVPVTGELPLTGAMSRSGTFERINYMTSGSVDIVVQGSDTFIVLQSDFSTPAGPDLVLYLTKNSATSSRADIKAGIEIGDLKSTTGMQMYKLPAGTDISQYNSVTIHCKAFNVPWSFAPLS